MPFRQLMSLRVSLFRGDEMDAKFLTCDLKKFASPRNCLTSCTLRGGRASLTHLSLSMPGRMP